MARGGRLPLSPGSGCHPLPVSPLELARSDRHCPGCNRVPLALWPLGAERVLLSRAWRLAQESRELRQVVSRPLSVRRCVQLSRVVRRLEALADPALPVSLEPDLRRLQDLASSRLAQDRRALPTLSRVDHLGAFLLREQELLRARPLVSRTHALWERAVHAGLTQAEALGDLDPSGVESSSFVQRALVLASRCEDPGPDHVLVVGLPSGGAGRLVDASLDELARAAFPALASHDPFRALLVPERVARRIGEESGSGWDFGPARGVSTAVLETALTLWDEADLGSPFLSPEGALEAAGHLLAGAPAA